MRHILLAKSRKESKTMKVVTVKTPKIISAIIRLFTKNKNR